MKYTLTALTAFALLAPVVADAQTTAAAAPAATPEHSLTGNLTLVSDYRFRGISQSYKLPAVQGGIDYAHSSGLYVGNQGTGTLNGAGARALALIRRYATHRHW
jgi:uncharacterized protein (TIGR02001 family)